jgi:hypothetical protein
MPKAEILSAIKDMARKGEVSLKELEEAFAAGHSAAPVLPGARFSGVPPVLSYLGGAVVYAGIVVFLGVNWPSLSPLTKMLASFGASIAAFVTGAVLYHNAVTKSAASAFFLVFSLTMPLGFSICWQEAGMDPGSAGRLSLTSGACLVIYLLLFAVFRETLFLLFALLSGTYFFFAFTQLFSSEAWRSTADWAFVWSRTAAAGLAYMGLGWYFSGKDRKILAEFLYGLGSFVFLGGMTLLAWILSYRPKFVWEAVLPVLIFGIIFLSLRLKNRTALASGVFFLLAYISGVTLKHFSSGAGWPLALVLAGLALMVCGCMFLYRKNSFPLLPAAKKQLRLPFFRKGVRTAEPGAEHGNPPP